MLTELHIEHLGVIERVDLRLHGGLTAVTGETGAGKTMLVEALDLLVGGRADAAIVRPGAAEARVDGRFVAGDRELVLTRVVPADGRSRAYIDGRPATAAALADTASELVELHGQHAHQSLLGAATQRAALDAFGGIDLSARQEARGRLVEIDAELATLGGDERARAREIDLLTFQVAELEAAAIESADEDTRLAVEEDSLADAVGHREAAASALSALVDDGGARDALGSAVTALGTRAPFATEAQRLRGLLAELDDLTRDLRDGADGIDDDPDRLAAVRGRRQLLRDLGRKYGADLTEVLRYSAEASARLAELERFDQRAAELDDVRAAAAAAEAEASRAVGDARRGSSAALGAAVTDALRTLALPHAEVVVDVGRADEDPGGDRVQFLFTANPGSPVLPLTKVASGGELARAMLALRLVLTSVAGSGGPDATYIFDEVDAGIGGQAAHAVGAALAGVARANQVLVVTHLAQVAAQADTHLVVAKSVTAGITRTTVTVVDEHQRVDEVARMLSGVEGGDAARRHAEQLLSR